MKYDSKHMNKYAKAHCGRHPGTRGRKPVLRIVSINFLTN